MDDFRAAGTGPLIALSSSRLQRSIRVFRALVDIVDEVRAFRGDDRGVCGIHAVRISIAAASSPDVASAELREDRCRPVPAGVDHRVDSDKPVRGEHISIAAGCHLEQLVVHLHERRHPERCRTAPRQDVSRAESRREENERGVLIV